MPTFSKHTMTAEEEATWLANSEYTFPVPTMGHVYYVLHKSGLGWREVEAALGKAQSTASTTATWHDVESCLWCIR